MGLNGTVQNGRDTKIGYIGVKHAGMGQNEMEYNGIRWNGMSRN